MAGSVDNRIVQISFDNAKFEANVKVTLQSLTSLDAAIKKIGTSNGLSELTKAASKVDFKGLSDAIDKINAKLGFPEAAQGFGNIENASNKTQLTGVSSALDKVKQKLGFGGEAAQGFGEIEGASNKTTLSGISSAIDKVKMKLSGLGSGEEFAKVEGASDRVTLSGLNSAIDSVSVHFGTMQAAGLAALATIVSKATTAGGQLVKSLTVEPVSSGLKEYELQLNSVQTILANTEASGATLKDVNAALLELNHYADKTIYNFGQMAKNIGTFTAAGVDLDTATEAIKGIANLAALSGSNAEQASHAMYQLSQAIAAGKVTAQDWTSVVTANMGGTIFKKALVETAIAMGELDKAQVKVLDKMGNLSIKGQTFRESIMTRPGDKPWLTSKVLTTALQTFTGDMSRAELAAKGFSDAQIDAIQKTAKTAVESATKVKTLSQLIDVAKETAQSGWAITWQTIFGDFEEARTMFTNMSNAVNGFINDNANARNKVLADWKALGGRTALFDGLKNALEAVGSVLKPIKDAFRDVFPAQTGKGLYDLTVRFRDFTERLKIGAETAGKIRDAFRGVFSVFHIGVSIVGKILGLFGKLVGIGVEGSGGFLDIAAAVGNFLTAADQAISKGSGLTKVFDGIGSVLALPIKLLQGLAKALASVFGGSNSSAGEGAAKSFDDLGASLGPLAGLAEVVSAAWNALMGVFAKVGDLLQPVIGGFRDFGNQIANALSTGGFENVFDVIQTALIGGIFLTIKKALGQGMNVDLGGGLMEKIGDTFGILNKQLTVMQNNIKANTLLQIASAVAVLAAAVVAFSLVNPDRLAAAMTATAAGLGQLVGAMSLLTKIGGTGAFLQMPFIAASLILLAAAVDVLAIAVIALSRLSWEEIGKGLVAVGGSLLAISIGTKLMGPALIGVGPALIPVAIGLNILAVAMKIFATMKWEEIGKGLAAVTVGLIAVGLASNALGPGLLLSGPGLIALAVGLNILAGAVAIFGKMDLASMGKGLLGVTLAVGLLGTAAGLLPPTLALQAAGLVILGIALTGIASAIALMSGMSVGAMAKGIIGLGAALVVLGFGLSAMGGSALGVAALIGAAVGLNMLVPVIGILGNMKWGTIGKGLLAIAATMGVIALAGAVAGPAFVILGAGMLALGIGIAGIGAGLYLVAKGLALLSSEGQKGMANLAVAITAFLAILPKIAIDFVKGLVAILDGIAKVAPQIATAIVKIGGTLINALIQLTPKIGEFLTVLIQQVVMIITTQSGPIMQAGWVLMQNLLLGIRNHIGEIVTLGADIVVNFLNGLASKAGDILNAAGRLGVSIVTGILSQQSKMVTAGVTMITRFLSGIANSAGKIVTAATNAATKFISRVAASAGQMVNTGANFIIKMISGIASAGGRLVTAATSAAGKFVRGVATGLVKMVDQGEKAIIDFMNGVANALRANQSDLNEAGKNLSNAIMQGAIEGAISAAEGVIQAILAPFKSAIDRVKNAIKSKSPSRVFMDIGKNMMLGAQIGVQRNADGVVASVADVAHSMIAVGDLMAYNLGKGIADNVTASAAVKTAAGKTVQGYKTALKIQARETAAGQELGKYISKDFKDALKGSGDDIQKAFDGLNEKLKSAMDSARQTISQQTSKLRELLKAKKLDYTAIARAQAVINQNEKLLISANGAKKKLEKIAKDNSQSLIDASANLEKSTQALKDAQTELENLKNAKEQAIKSYADQFSTVPDIDSESKNPLPKFLKDLRTRSAAVEKYRQTLDALRAAGLDDATYEKLLSQGVSGQTFASQLLAAGPAAINEINSLDISMQTSAQQLAQSAGNALHDAGIAAKDGFVAGLQKTVDTDTETYNAVAKKVIDAVNNELKISEGESKEFESVGIYALKGLKKGLKDKKHKDSIYKAVRAIARDMINEMKDELKIKSPSKVFAELGAFTMLGMAQGVAGGSGNVTDAVGSAGSDAVSEMKKSMGDISSLLSSEIDPNPVITPVLDLSDVQEKAKKMADLYSASEIAAGASYGQAVAISQSQRAAQEAAPAETQSVQEIKFEQNNYSPESLSETEIYRLTNNQLSQARRALGLT